MNFNIIQWLALACVVLGAVSTGSAQLTDIFGAGTAKGLVSAASLLSTIVNGFIMVFTGQTKVAQYADQSSLVKSVAAMPGVEPLRVNAQATPELAALALDPTQAKISPAPGKEQAVEDVAKTGN